MKSPRWIVLGVCAGALVLAGVLPPTLASATTPTSTPTITSPDGTSAITSNPLSVSATSTDSDPQAFVRFVLDGGHAGAYVADANIQGDGSASTSLPVVGLDGGVDLVAYDCDGSVAPPDCNTGAPATVHLTINLPNPTITAPAPGSTQHDQVTVNVNDDNGGGITFTLDNGNPFFDTTGPYSHVFSLVGLSQGTHTVKVTQCNNDGSVCQGPSDSVSFNHSTAPTTTPTITSPTAAITSDPMTVSATSNDTDAQAFVRFVLDGGHGGSYVADAPINGAGNASTTMPVAGLDGGANLVAYDCDGQVTPAVCNTGSPDTLHVTLDLPAPVIEFPADGEHFQQSVEVTVNGAAGAMQFRLPGVETAVESTGPLYVHTFDISSLNDGDTGIITVTQCNSGGDVCQGKSAQVSFVKDTSGPTWTPASASPKTFYPGKDPGREYRDHTRLATHVADAVTGVRLVIRNVHNKRVRIVNLADQAPGRFGWTWNGRNDANKRVPAGTYSFRFSGLDAAANPGSSDPGTVMVSSKVLRVVHVKLTKTALRTRPQAKTSKCSAPFPLVRGTPAPHFRGGVGYYSNYFCKQGVQQSIASATHHIAIMRAIRYNNVRVDVYGAQAAKHGGAAHLLYWRPGKGTGLTPTHRAPLATQGAWHLGRPAALRPLVKDHTFKWAVYTYKGAWYNVAKFRITYSAYTLRRPPKH